MEALLGALKQGVDNWNSQRDHGLKGAKIDLSGADLNGSLLEKANLREVILSRSNLNHAKLAGADLSGSDLQSASLEGAELQWANLEAANLKDANLQRADFREVLNLTGEQVQSARNWLLASYSESLLNQLGLSGDHNDRIATSDLSGFDFKSSNLAKADLEGVNLNKADLTATDLSSANLRSANLAAANLSGANLEGTDLQNAQELIANQVRQARNWPLALYGRQLCVELGLSIDHNLEITNRKLAGTQLERANLQGANLEGFSIARVNLQKANLRDVSFTNADLQETDLREAAGLTRQQIIMAKNWPLAFYSSDILQQLGLPNDHNERIQRKDLSGLNLPGVALIDSDLEGFDFRKSNLQSADLQASNLENAKLGEANLIEANLERCRFSGAELHKTNLARARVRNAINLTNAQLTEARNWILAFYDDATKETLGLTGLSDENITQKHFQDCVLDLANLPEVDLEGAILSRVQLKRANLRGANLKKAELSSATLHGADLRDANLENAKLGQADLSGANLRGANLIGVDLKGATLNQTTLRDANLQDADLQSAKFILSGQLGGANVSGAILPVEIKEFKGLASIDESSKNASSLFIAMLAACIYAILTIASTTDSALLTNSASSPLPIVQTVIPIVGFYIVAPLLIVALYIYFHLSLQRLWEQLADQPAVLPDGKTLDKCVYPWLLNGLVQSYFHRLGKQRPSLSRLQAGLSFALAWWFVPVTLILFWARYLPRLDWNVTLLHILLITVCCCSAVAFHRLTSITLRGLPREPLSWKQPWNNKGMLAIWLLGPIIAGALIFISLGIVARPIWPPCSIERKKFGRSVREAKLNLSQQFFSMFRFPFAELTESDLSTKPANWSGKTSDDLTLVKGATLRERNLSYSEATRAFLINADLRLAKMVEANLNEADLRNAVLLQADLRNSCLANSDLSGANLEGADLTGATVEGANLFGANLSNTKFEESVLRSARNWIFALYDTERLKLLHLALDHNNRVLNKDFSGYDLREIPFDQNNLNDFNLSQANLFKVNLANASLKAANLRGSTLSHASLIGAHLEKAILVGANLEGANLTGAHLEGADLTDATGLTQAQIRDAVIDDTTILPKTLKTMNQSKLKNTSNTSKQ